MIRPSVVALLTLSLILAGVVSCTSPTEPEPEIKIGVIAYTVGDSQICCGTPTLHTVELIEQEVNSNGGLNVNGKMHRVTVIVEGTDNTPEQVVAAAKRLINQENVVAIIGPQHSGEAIPVGEVAEGSRIPMISPMSTNARTTRDRPYVFRVGFLDELQGRTLAKFAFEEISSRRAAVLYNIAKPYSHGLADIFKQTFTDMGGEIVSFESYTTGQSDFSDQLGKIHRQKPDLLFLPNHNSDVLIQGPQARKLGISAVFLGSDGWDETELAGLSEFDGSYKSAHWSESIDSKSNRLFISEYRRLHDEDPNNTAALTYDAFGMIFDAIELMGKADPESIKEGLYRLPPYWGLSGIIDFSDTGDPEKNVVILNFRDGKVFFHRMFSP